MVPLFSRKAWLTVLSAVLFVLALGFVQFYLAWICLVPFFVVLQAHSGKRAFYSGALFGLVFGSLTLYWLPLAVSGLSEEATGKSIITGILVFGIVALYYGVLALGFSRLKRQRTGLWSNALLMAAIWTIGECLLSMVFSGMPWFSVSIGNTILGNLYAVQPAEYGGIHILNFVVVLVNYLFAYFIQTRQWPKLAVPVGLVAVYLGIGYGILYRFEQRRSASGPPVTIALVTGNIPEETKWNDENGNSLAAVLLDLNRRALATKPDFVLWPESIVPWTYRADDDLLKEILRQTMLYSNAWHIVGMSTYLSPNRLYNSAYCLRPDGGIAGRHDKHYLVSMAEQPITVFSLPFLKEDDSYIYCKPGKEGTVVAGPKGKVGMLICSEVYIREPAAAAVKNGAEFLVSLSNNDLFGAAAGAVHQHFFRNRLRAVEVRKDIAASCNMGISGMFSATGALVSAHWPDGGFTETVVVHPNRNMPVPGYYRNLIIGGSISTLLVFLFFTAKERRS